MDESAVKRKDNYARYHRVKLLHYSGSRVAWVSSKSNHLLAFMKACTIIEAKNADRDFTVGFSG